MYDAYPWSRRPLIPHRTYHDEGRQKNCCAATAEHGSMICSAQRYEGGSTQKEPGSGGAQFDVLA
jgi:hypothetical protein